MKGFIGHYALEIYTVIALVFITGAAIAGGLSVEQKFIVAFSLLFVLHEWEESRYPGGFVDLMGGALKLDFDEETKRASRIPTGLLLLAFTLVPFFLDGALGPVPFIVPVYLCVFEGFVHVAGIRIFRMPKPYTPGLVTAELELVAGVAAIAYLCANGLATGWDFLIALPIYLLCFMAMQKCLTMMVGIRYRDLPRRMRAYVLGR